MSTNPHPNLVFLFADQLRYQSLGYAGDRYAYTPEMDRLAERSVNFRQAVSVFPVCGPFRNSLFTGCYPSTTGMFDNGLRCMTETDAFGHVLERNGYRTGYIGKWHLYEGGRDAFVPPGPARLGFDQLWQSYNWNHDYYNGFYYEDTPVPIQMEGYQTSVQTDMAEKFLTKGDSDPFALFVSYEVPHPPNDVSQNPDGEYYQLSSKPPAMPANAEVDLFRGPHKQSDEWFASEWFSDQDEQVRSYYLQTAAFDEAVGRICRTLEKTGQMENIILVVTSDHGEMLFSHRRRHKRIFYEESVRVPFLLSFPGRYQGTTTDACLNTPDIMPTLLELMDLPIPDQIEGRSLVSDIEQPRLDDCAFLQGMSESSFFASEEWRGIRDGRYHYVLTREPREEFLFDLEHDPGQVRNFAGDPDKKELLTDMRARLEESLRKRSDTFESTGWYREHWTQDAKIVESATRQKA